MIDRICKTCDKHFFVYPSEIKHRNVQFCSRGCYTKSRVGKPLSPEHKASVAKADRRRLTGIKTEDAPFYGQHHSKEHREKISKLMKERFAGSPENHPWFGRQHTEGEILKMSNSISKVIKELWQDPEYRARALEGARGRGQNPLFRLKDSEAHRRLWQNHEFVKKMMLAFSKKPTKPEKQLEAILDRHFPLFKYNGDFSQGMMLGGLTPDFVNVNGKKQVIEVFGDYWHSPEIIGDDWRRSELGKVMIYNSVGFDCLVIWERELKKLTEEEIVEKISDFSKGGKRCPV